jgi:uncharacterized protein YcfJ
MAQMGPMGRGVNETTAAAGGVVDAVCGGVEAERVGSDEGEAVQSAVAIVGHPLAGATSVTRLRLPWYPEQVVSARGFRAQS